MIGNTIPKTQLKPQQPDRRYWGFIVVKTYPLTCLSVCLVSAVTGSLDEDFHEVPSV